MNSSPEKSQRIVVPLAGALTVATAEDCRVRLLAALESASTVVVDATAVTTWDVFGLQLLHAAQRSACLRGKTFEVLPSTSVQSACAAAAVEAAAIGLRTSSIQP